MKIIFVDCCVVQTNNCDENVFQTAVVSPDDLEAKLRAPGKA